MFNLKATSSCTLTITLDAHDTLRLGAGVHELKEIFKFKTLDADSMLDYIVRLEGSTKVVTDSYTKCSCGKDVMYSYVQLGNLDPEGKEVKVERLASYDYKTEKDADTTHKRFLSEIANAIKDLST